MRISFDLDDTLICYGDTAPCAARFPLPLRMVFGDEPLRQGSRELLRVLRADGHEVWIYTSSGRRRGRIRRWLWLHGIRVDGVVDGARHAACFGTGSLPTKRPHAFGIDLHVDDSAGVAREGEQFGFDVCVIQPSRVDWTEQVLRAVAANGRGQ